MFTLSLLCGLALSSPWPDISKPVPTSFEDKASKDRALVIAVGDYAELSDIPGAVQNARDWRTWLTKGQKLRPRNLQYLYNEKATKKNIERVADVIGGQSKAGDRIWLIFIGHGAASKDGGEGVLLGVDVQKDATSMYNRSVYLSKILSLLGQNGAQVYGILDTSFSGQNRHGQALAPNLPPLKAAPTSLADSFIVTAGLSKQYAGLLPGLGRPAFSYLMLGGLRGWADGITNDTQDGKVTLSESLLYSRTILEALEIYSEHSQTPQGYGKDTNTPLSKAIEKGPELTTILGTLKKTDVHVPSVTFDSVPSGDGTKVFVDGRLICTQTPCTKQVSSGSHEITILRSRYKKWSEKKIISEDTVIEATLNPSFGYFSLSTNFPKVNFILRPAQQKDAWQVLEAPINQMELNTGEYVLRANDKCYYGAKGAEYHFDLPEGGHAELSYEVKPRPAGLRVLAKDSVGNPIRVRVFVDGQFLGENIQPFTVGLCSKELKVRYAEQELTTPLSLKANTLLDLEVQLPKTLEPKKREHSKIAKRPYEEKRISAGTFMLGCTKGDTFCSPMEQPQHKVTIKKDFYIMKTEVTQGFYQSLMESNPSHFASCGANCPVDQISLYDAVRFANALSYNEGLDICYKIDESDQPTVEWIDTQCKGWRLPTEAEWEYAARGDQSYLYSGSRLAEEVAWFGGWERKPDGKEVNLNNGNSGEKPHPVAQKLANDFGLYDMSGNVSEWVWDNFRRYDKYQEPFAASVQQRKPTTAILRGGNWYQSFAYTRVSTRFLNDPWDRRIDVGFRLVRTAP